jgi:hypothetical protein
MVNGIFDLPFVALVGVGFNPQRPAPLVEVHEDPTKFVWRQFSFQTFTPQMPGRTHLSRLLLRWKWPYIVGIELAANLCVAWQQTNFNEQLSQLPFALSAAANIPSLASRLSTFLILGRSSLVLALVYAGGKHANAERNAMLRCIYPRRSD